MDEKILASALLLVAVAGLTTAGTAYADNATSPTPAEEKEYAEPMNVLGGTIHVFNDRICLNGYCKDGGTLPVFIDGAVGLNTQEPIKLEIAYCGYFEAIPVGCIGGENPRTVRADNEGNGNFLAKWTVTKNHYGGLYKVTAVVDGMELQVGSTMMDVINGDLNNLFLILNRIEPVSYTPVTADNAVIRVLDVRYGETSGTVSYEICAKRDLKNPTFEIKSDSKIEQVSNEMELAEGECHEGAYTIRAKSPTTIFIPLAGAGNAGTQEPATYEIPDWVKQTAGWWADGLIDDETYVKSIEYLIEVGIIRVG